MFAVAVGGGGGGFFYILYTTKQLKGFRKILGFIYNNLVMVIMFSPDSKLFCGQRCGREVDYAKTVGLLAMQFS